MPTIVIIIAAFVGVTALVGGVASLFLNGQSENIEDRLEVLAGMKTAAQLKAEKGEKTLLAGPLDDVPGMLEAYFSRLLNIRLLLDQAAMKATPTQFISLCGVLALIGGVAGSFSPAGPLIVAPIAAISLGFLPIMYAMFMRKRRMGKFAKQLPEALELMARALRAGHSLGSGFQLCGSEMTEPLGPEFHRVFEEQNLGVTLEDALDGMTERVPNLDLKFFATAVALQRQTGGDLAEILDKIGELVRERFKIFGQIQALTGEGRLSGLVLLALPPFLLCVMLKLNYEYTMILFTDEIGKKVLAVVVFLQILGAVVIKKIVNIKV